MRNPVTIPLTKDKTRNLIIDLENVISIFDRENGKCLITISENGKNEYADSEFTASELYEEICSPSK